MKFFETSAVHAAGPNRQSRSARDDGSPTPFASPVASPRHSGRLGEAAPTLVEEATPEFTPPHSPTACPITLRWQDAQPPSSRQVNATRGCSCRCYMPGNLSEAAWAAWRSLPNQGRTRFDNLAETLACEAQENGEAQPRIPAADAAFVTSLQALPDAPLPLAAAMLLAMAPDGYVSAGVQATLLEAYAAAAGAAAAETFADDLRASPPAPGPRRRQPRRRRPRAQPTVAAAAEHHNDSDNAHTQVPECLAQALASPGQWERLDAVDQTEEYRHAAPMLQDAPPCMRGAVRSAFNASTKRASRGRRCRPRRQPGQCSSSGPGLEVVPARATYVADAGDATRLARSRRIAQPRCGLPARRVDPAHPQCQAVPAAFLGPQAGVAARRGF